MARTLLDLAGRNGGRGLRDAVERADRLDLLDLTAIDDILSRCGTHRGRTRLRAATELYRDESFFRARSERLLRGAIKAAGLPMPAMNLFIEGHELDAYWEAEQFAVEVDSWVWHGSPRAFEDDRVRQEELKLAGIELVRITARRLEREPKQVAKRLGLLLDQRRRQLRLPKPPR